MRLTTTAIKAAKVTNGKPFSTPKPKAGAKNPPRGRRVQIFGDHHHGLALRVVEFDDGTSSKSWIQQINVIGKRTNVGLGPFPLVTLREAREAAFDNARRARRGEDVRTRNLGGTGNGAGMTFADAWQAQYEHKLPTWRHDRVAQQWRSRYKHHMKEPLGDKLVDAITQEDIVAALEPKWRETPTVSINVFSEIFQTLERCVAKKQLSRLPTTREVVKVILGDQQKSETEHWAAVPHAEIPSAVEMMMDSDAHPTHKLALLFTILTASRQIETRRAEWSMFDLSRHVWTQSGDFMKSGKKHSIPLTAPMLKILAIVGDADSGGFVFNGFNGTEVPADDMLDIVKACGLVDIEGRSATMHGFRSSFGDWAVSKGHSEDLVDVCLAHTVRSKVRRAYIRDDRLDERRELGAAWSAYCLSGIADHDALYTALASGS